MSDIKICPLPYQIPSVYKAHCYGKKIDDKIISCNFSYSSKNEYELVDIMKAHLKYYPNHVIVKSIVDIMNAYTGND